MNLDSVLERLEGVQKNGQGYTAICPAHDDHTPSLSASSGGDGRILLNCHAGCSFDDIVKSMGVEPKDLFAPHSGNGGIRPTTKKEKRPEPEPIADAVVDRLHEALSEKARGYLYKERMLTQEVVNHYQLGTENRNGEKRITIPIRDAHGKVRDMRRWLSPEGRVNDRAKKILHWAKGYGAPRLFPEDQLDHDELVFCEGELDALALVSNGIAAITLTAGADTAPDLETARRFQGKTVTLFGDHDDAGKKGALKRAEALVPHARQVQIASWPDDRPKGWDPTDELRGHGVESLQAILAKAEPYHPKEAITSVSPPASKETKLFHLALPATVWRGIVGDYRDMLADTTEASDAYHLFTFLGCAGSIIGRRAYLLYGLPLYGNLYVTIVGASGLTRKTTSLRHSERTVCEVDPSWRVLRGVSSAEGLLAQIADPWTKENAKGDIIDQGGTSDKRMMVWLGELSSLLKKAKQDRVANIIPLLTEAFDCPPDLHLPTRADPITVTEPYISLMCASTPSWLEDLQDRDVLGGFANRFIYILGEPKPPIPFPEPPRSDLQDRIIARLSDLQAWLPDQGLRLELTSPARELWVEFYTRWHSLSWPDELLAAILQRIPDITLKIAVIYATLEKRTQIDAEILKTAIDAGGYAVASAQRIFSDFHTSREGKLEKRISSVLEPGPMKFGDLHRAVGGRYSTKALNGALDALKHAGQVWRKEQGSTVIWGRPENA